MGASPAEAVYIVLFQAGITAECPRICRAILLDNFKLEFRPIADLIELEGKGVCHATTCKCCCFGAARRCIGNWFHSLPSSSRPPAFGERPPHCLKKKAVPA